MSTPKTTKPEQQFRRELLLLTVAGVVLNGAFGVGAAIVSEGDGVVYVIVGIASGVGVGASVTTYLAYGWAAQSSARWRAAAEDLKRVADKAIGIAERATTTASARRRYGGRSHGASRRTRRVGAPARVGTDRRGPGDRSSGTTPSTPARGHIGGRPQ